ncbi:unnamed protein product [Adineta steineri]|uniref:Uncharacterized protein n=1 Tax=Adineta steineri TaxID=433720 RepID=A0A815T4I7_9BILA|nr:unnamed protein product [Adineta steineri]
MVDWLKGHVNCLKIKHFEGRHFCEGTELSIFTNLRTVRLLPKALTTLSKDISQVFPTVQYLDLRDEIELFHSERVDQIQKLFPNVEHLVLNTESLDCVPNLACCLPRLRSLTCIMHDQDSEWNPYSITYHTSRWSQSLRRKCDLFFCREEVFLIIWLDKASIENTQWHTFSTKKTPKEKRQGFAALFDASNSEDNSDDDENDYYGCRNVRNNTFSNLTRLRKNFCNRIRYFLRFCRRKPTFSRIYKHE